MDRGPWVTIIGLGEDGPDGLTGASLAALEEAEIVMGPARHLALLPELRAETVTWPVPFADGIDLLLSHRGRRVVVLASGDPFWFGAGSVLARHLKPDEWRALPGMSCFALAASRLGWALESTICLGLHAAPLTRLRPHLAPGMRLIVTLRDGAAVGDLGNYFVHEGFGDSVLHVMEALAGPRDRVTTHLAAAVTGPFDHPVCVAIEVQGAGRVMPKTSGLTDDWFDHDGQISKRPVRALTLSALAPRPFEHLWDIGGGSGSISIEWLLSHATTQATVIEADPERAARLAANARRIGVDRLTVVTGHAPEALDGLTAADVVFVGGGLSFALLARLETLAKGARLVANAVTLESEALLTTAHARKGGSLLRIDLSNSKPLGSKRGWSASYPIVQWSVTL